MRLDPRSMVRGCAQRIPLIVSSDSQDSTDFVDFKLASKSLFVNAIKLELPFELRSVIPKLAVPKTYLHVCKANYSLCVAFGLENYSVNSLNLRHIGKHLCLLV